MTKVLKFRALFMCAKHEMYERLEKVVTKFLEVKVEINSVHNRTKLLHPLRH